MTLELGVLISGRGSNLAAILQAIDCGTLDARVRLVLSSRVDAPGLEKARLARVPSVTVDPRAHSDRMSFEQAMVDELRRAGCEWVVLAGFLRILGREFLEAFPSRILNIHPSLLPAFPGLDAQGQALASGVTETGCTVHVVDERIDHGPILGQRAVPIRPDDTRDALADRILACEHALLVETLASIARGELVVPGRVSERP